MDEVYQSIAALFTGGMLFVTLGLLVLMIVAWCFIFKKAGEAPGKLFIPVYGQYLMYKVADCGGLFILNIGVSVVGGIIASIVGSAGTTRSYYGGSYMSEGTATAILVIYGIILIISFITGIIFNVRLARAFGKGGGFAVGLIFLNPIFICILAFGGAQYVYYSSALKNAPERWMCPVCGQYNSPYAQACEKCGTQRPRQ